MIMFFWAPAWKSLKMVFRKNIGIHQFLHLTLGGLLFKACTSKDYNQVITTLEQAAPLMTFLIKQGE